MTEDGRPETVGEVRRLLWSHADRWPADFKHHVFMARALLAVATAKFGPSWTGQEPLAPPSEAEGDEAAISLRRFRAVCEAVAQACEAGELTTFYRETETGAMVPLGAEHWRLDNWVHRFYRCQIDPERPMRADVVHWAEPGEWLYVQRASLDRHLSAGQAPEAPPSRLDQANAPPDLSVADWRVRPGERQSVWVFRNEVIAEAERRLVTGEAGKKRSVNGVLPVMAKECGVPWTQKSIATLRGRS